MGHGVRYVWGKKTMEQKAALDLTMGAAIAILPDCKAVGRVVSRQLKSKRGISCDMVYPDGSTARACVDAEYLVPCPASELARLP